jgi:hypothetical protein
MYEIGAAIILMLIIIIIFMYVIKLKDRTPTEPPEQEPEPETDEKPRRVSFGPPQERQYDLSQSEVQDKRRQPTSAPRVHTIAELRDNNPNQLLKLASYLGTRYYSAKYNSSVKLLNIYPNNQDGNRFVMEFEYKSLSDNDIGSDIRIFSIKDSPQGIAFDKMGGYNGANIVA